MLHVLYSLVFEGVWLAGLQNPGDPSPAPDYSTGWNCPRSCMPVGMTVSQLRTSHTPETVDPQSPTLPLMAQCLQPTITNDQWAKFPLSPSLYGPYAHVPWPPPPTSTLIPAYKTSHHDLVWGFLYHCSEVAILCLPPINLFHEVCCGVILWYSLAQEGRDTFSL